MRRALERVVERQLTDLFFQALALGDFAGDAVVPNDFSLRIAVELGHYLAPNDAAILATVFQLKGQESPRGAGGVFHRPAFEQAFDQGEALVSEHLKDMVPHHFVGPKSVHAFVCRADVGYDEPTVCPQEIILRILRQHAVEGLAFVQLLGAFGHQGLHGAVALLQAIEGVALAVLHALAQHGKPLCTIIPSEPSWRKTNTIRVTSLDNSWPPLGKWM